MKKLLILGGSGFIGSSIVDYGINKKLIKNRINKIYILSRSIRFSQNKKKHISITYISKNMLDVIKLPQVDYIIYCLKNRNIQTSNSYFNQFLELQYRGRIDSSVMNDNKDIYRDLFYAMELVANTNIGPKKQYNSFGCSIKWKNNE